MGIAPKVRFEGFSGAWEQRKFGEFYKKSSEKNDGSIGMDKNITVATMQFKEDVKVSTEEYLRTYYTFNVGDIAFEGHQSKEFRFGRFVENDIGDGIVSHIFAVFRPIVDYDLKFWKYAINNESLMRRVLSRSTKASTMMHDLVTDDFLEQSFLLPSVGEQKQIGEFLAGIDHLITLHQRKCKALETAKRFYLQNMFPQKDETTPRIRFEGFSGAWEERRFSDLYEKVTEKNDLIFGTDKIISVANMYYKEDTSKSDDDYMRTYNVMRLGDIAFEGNKSKNFAHGRFVENTIGDGIVSHVFDVFRPIAEYDLLFWKYLINYEGVMGRIMVRCTKASTMMTNLVTNDFLKESIAVPCIAEQRKIGSFFESLDSLITLHRRKVSALQTLKKFLLQNMFI